MYESDYQLSRRPFAATPDPASFFACETNQGAFDALVVCLERGLGIGVLTGAAGSGKTMLCRRLMTELADHFETVFIANSNLSTSRALLQAILFELGIEFSRKDDQELRFELRQHLQRLPSDQQGIVLVIDEAHLLPDELLEEVRLLADLANGDVPLVRVLISGQLRLEERFTERAFEALNQRIGAHVTLEALTQNEAAEYIAHRLTWAGAEPLSLFTQQALRNVARASGGVPRCIHQLADHALMLAYSRNERPVEVATIQEALQHLKSLPLQWNDLTELSSFQSSDEDSPSEGSIDDHLVDAEEALRLAAEFDAEFEAEFASESHDEESEAADDLTGFADIPYRATDEVLDVAETVAFEFGADSTEPEAHVVEPEQCSSDSDSFCEQDASISGLALPDRAAIGADELPHSPSVVASHKVMSDAVADAPSDGLCITLAASNRRQTRTERIRPDAETVADCAVQPSNSACSAGSCSDFGNVTPRVHISESNTSHIASQKDLAVVPFEEEVVVDHYSVLQEPEFSGIIWNLASKTARPSAQKVAAKSFCESIDLVDEAPRLTLEFDQRVEAEDESSDLSDEIRPFEPHRHFDALMPIFDELIEEDGGQPSRPDARRREIEDVEAEMFDAISFEDQQAEDLIGTEVLDLVFETQAALRKSQSAIANSLQKHLDQISDDQDDKIDPFAATRFDVVQPDDSDLRHCPQPVASESRASMPSQEIPRRDAPQSRPFGRLFTDLRKKQRKVS